MTKEAAPHLQLDRDKREVAVFHDPKPDFGLRENYLAGMLARLFPDAMVDRLDAMIDALPDDASALTDQERTDELAEVDAELERRNREEELLISTAFGLGLDILRRARADPACVLGLRAVLPAAVQASAAE